MKYYYTLDEVKKIMTGKDPEVFWKTFLKNYRPSPYRIFDDNTVNGGEGFSRLEKPKKDFKSIEAYRFSCLENDMNIFTDILKLQGANNKTTSCLQEIRNLKKLIAKKDLSTLVWCMPQFFFRLSRFIARPGITVIKNKRIANDKQGKNSAKTRLDKSEPHRKYYLQLCRDNSKMSVRKWNDKFQIWLTENKIDTIYHRNTLKEWRKNAGLNK